MTAVTAAEPEPDRLSRDIVEQPPDDAAEQRMAALLTEIGVRQARERAAREQQDDAE